MPEAEDLAQLRKMNLQLLRQLRLGQEEIRRSVAWARGAIQLFPKLTKGEGSSIQSSEAWCSQDEETTVSSEPTTQLGPCPAPRAATGDREASDQEPEGRSQEPAPQSSTGNNSETTKNESSLESVSSSDSASSSIPQGQEPKVSWRPISRPTSLNLPSSPEAAKLGPTIDPVLFGLQRPLHETEDPGGLRPILTAQQWQNFKTSQVPAWFGSESINPKLRWLPTSSHLPGGQLPSCPHDQDFLIPKESWHMKPYLGYDVIAGLLDSTSPITHKSENYFSNLQDFRKANKEDCISRYPELDPLDLSSTTRNKQTPDSHQCLHCYRVNQRLFTVPLDPLATCCMCKTFRGQRGRETVDHPAQIRVSVPVSTFLPPHQYPIHRRKSFDASDTMALPRHCLMGWDNIPTSSACSSALSSLDLRTSLDPGTQQTEPPDLSGWVNQRMPIPASRGTESPPTVRVPTVRRPQSSRSSNWNWSDSLLSMSRTTQFELSNVAERYLSGSRRPPRP
ncbi:migration and invasion-inhibitory protein [Gracilinanus agilis]|uniref:migration and invasion-inhibitory protein n=1 Tax=Gracilinanus agilis TaxID=191870 RepID=UPI001CFDF6F8|nr:migration and invasion-inhibitory protein [Gracilinanus agilis]